MKDSRDPVFRHAVERYAEVGVDVERALRRLDQVAVSVNCWQADDVTGLEGRDHLGGGGSWQPDRTSVRREMPMKFVPIMSLPHGSFRDSDGLISTRCTWITMAHRWIEI